jgi:hypothetical protein
MLRNGIRRGAALALAAALFSAGACDDGGSGPGEAKSRSFYMAFTPLPYDFTLEARDYTYDKIHERVDMICHHFDDGIPWPEALEGKPYNPTVENELYDRQRRLRPGDKVYLALCPLDHDRKSLAKYWGATSNMELPPGWANKTFDDPDVITAYGNFLLDLIGRFGPDYVCFGAEVNGGFAENDPQLAAFEKFLKKVRDNVRARHPNVPLFLSFIIGGSGAEGTRQMNLARRFLKYSDYTAVSTYPFIEAAGGPRGDADPDNLPRNWFTKMHDLAPEKPYAVAETGYIAEDLVLQTYGIDIKGTEAWQEAYLRFLLQECNKLDAEFVVYFMVRDYDQGWERLKQQGFGEFYKMWRDCGLIDGSGDARPSLAVWDAWFGAGRSTAFALGG